MPLFLAVHKSGSPIDSNRIPKGWETYKNSCKELKIKAICVYYNAEEGTGYCITEASTKEEVLKAHSNMGMDTQELVEVKLLK